MSNFQAKPDPALQDKSISKSKYQKLKKE